MCLFFCLCECVLWFFSLLLLSCSLSYKIKIVYYKYYCSCKVLYRHRAKNGMSYTSSLKDMCRTHTVKFPPSNLLHTYHIFYKILALEDW